jgi:Flp pilus assembly secretin CpaC
MTATPKVGAIWAYATVVFALVASSDFASAGNAVFRAAPPTDPVRTLGAAPTETIHLTVGAAYEPLKLDRPFARVKIGDPKVVDIPEAGAGKLRSDREADLTPVGTGATNVIFFDKDDNVIKNINVTVDDGGLPGRIKINNKAQLNSYTLYRCSSTNCEYTSEVTVQEPAPLPRGNTNQNVNQSVSGEGAPPASVTIPSAHFSQ